MRRTDDAPSVWSRTGALDPHPGIARLPVREMTLTQTGTGRGEVDATIVASGDAVLLRARLWSASISAAIVDPCWTVFSHVLPLAGTCEINGHVAGPTSVFTPVDSEGMYVSGARRDVYTTVVRRDSFARSVAALLGVCPDDVRLDNRRLELTPAAARLLRHRIDRLVAERDEGPESQTAERFTEAVFGMLADAYLAAAYPEGLVPDRVRHACRIVRRAEERFAAAGERPVSLADLCEAAGVSASSLYRAFDIARGVPPLEYFRKRRLMDARLRLLRSAPSRGSVKRAALSAGLTELGRFSVEYRQLFNEAPSVTLAKTG